MFCVTGVPHVRSTSVPCGFGVVAPAVGHSLPFGIHDSSSTQTFRLFLKKSLLPAGLRLSLVAHPSASDLAAG